MLLDFKLKETAVCMSVAGGSDVVGDLRAIGSVYWAGETGTILVFV